VLSRCNRLYNTPSLRFIDLEHSPEIGVVAAWKRDAGNSAVPLFVQGIYAGNAGRLKTEGRRLKGKREERKVGR
jgi:hypothetical protein